MTNNESLPAAAVGRQPCGIGARAFAVRAHGNQQYSGEPYVMHLDHVASVLREYGFETPDFIDAAYLHDVLEDTEIIYDSLRESGFSPLTCQLVEAVTNEQGNNRDERNTATYPKIAGWTDATILKLADRIANSRCSHDFGRERFLRMYQGEYKGFRDALFRNVPETLQMWGELDSLLGRGLATAAGNNEKG